jgi:hypothetical protein
VATQFAAHWLRSPLAKTWRVSGVTIMKYDDKLIEDAVLALLATFSSDIGNAWKGFDFGVMNRLHEQGFIDNPVNKRKSIWLTPEGMERGRQIADQLFSARAQVEHGSDQIPEH